MFFWRLPLGFVRKTWILYITLNSTNFTGSGVLCGETDGDIRAEDKEGSHRGGPREKNPGVSGLYDAHEAKPAWEVDTLGRYMLTLESLLTPSSRLETHRGSWHELESTLPPPPGREWEQPMGQDAHPPIDGAWCSRHRGTLHSTPADMHTDMHSKEY